MNTLPLRTSFIHVGSVTPANGWYELVAPVVVRCVDHSAKE